MARTKLPFHAFFLCDCKSHALQIERYEDDELIYLTMWEPANCRYGFWHRVKTAWKVLMKGDPFADQLVMSEDDSTVLINLLTIARDGLKANEKAYEEVIKEWTGDDARSEPFT